MLRKGTISQLNGSALSIDLIQILAKEEVNLVSTTSRTLCGFDEATANI